MVKPISEPGRISILPDDCKVKLTEDLVINKGTILSRACNERGGKNYVEVPVAFGPDFTGWLVVQRCKDMENSGWFEEFKDGRD